MRSLSFVEATDIGSWQGVGEGERRTCAPGYESYHHMFCDMESPSRRIQIPVFSNLTATSLVTEFVVQVTNIIMFSNKYQLKKEVVTLYAILTPI